MEIVLLIYLENTHKLIYIHTVGVETMQHPGFPPIFIANISRLFHEPSQQVRSSRDLLELLLFVLLLLLNGN